MKKRLTWYMILILMLGACTPPMQTQKTVLPTDDLGTASTPSEFTPVQSAAISVLSKMLNLPAEKITVVSIEPKIWPDDCLGVPRVGVMCTQVPVEGVKVVLEANDKQYVYHVNQDGSAVVLANSEQGEQAIDPVEEIVINQLATNLGLDECDISVVSSSDVEFADSCMGVPMKDVKCAQEAVSGKIIALEAHGVQYEYRVRSNGAVIQPATLALIWTREGGVTGFCDSMTVFLSGEVYGVRCNADPDRTLGTFADLLSNDEIGQLDTWIKKFGQVDVDASDPEGISNRTEITLLFYGIGKGVPGKSDEQALLLWIQNLFQKLYP